MMKLTRTKLSPGDQQRVESFVTLDVCNRDKIHEIIKNKACAAHLCSDLCSAPRPSNNHSTAAVSEVPSHIARPPQF